MTLERRQFEELSALYGVQTSYEDVRHVRRHASQEALLRVLGDLGANVASMADVPNALAKRRCELAFRGIEPVLVAWDGEPIEFSLTVPKGTLKRASCFLRGEMDAGFVEWRSDLCDAADSSVATENGAHDFATYGLRLPQRVNLGYYELTVHVEDRSFRSQVIAAPSKVYCPNDGGERIWGGFLPLYAVRSERNWGAGDFTDLADLSAWLRSRGGRLVGTLPLLAAFLDEPFDPSPYSPASRLFWNEFYVDVERVPELAQCPAARDLLASAESQNAITELRNSEFVDYRALMSLKRRVLELLSADFYARRPPRFAHFSRYLRDHPRLDNYATFRAVYERRREPWPQWPAALRSGRIAAADFDPRVAEYHRYVQWLAAEQLDSLSREAAAAGDGLYLDLPLGVRHDGYDVWRNQRDFASAASAGAPPDAVYTKGQDWGFAPLHPEAIRENGYRHVREYLAHHMRFARTLRIDHVMGLHRLYWIPHGLSAADGVYVRYRADELYAVLSIESHWSRTAIIGENLGTVPKEVNLEMDRHGVRRMFVVQYEYDSAAVDEAASGNQSASHTSPLNAVPEATIASINTHDMPTFAAWWHADDVPDRVALGLMTPGEASAEIAARADIRRRTIAWLRREGWLDPATTAGDDDTQAVLFALVKFLAASPTESVLVNLEDLWLERRPQNVPGTSAERPNWRRKARRSLEALRSDAGICELFSAIDRLRAARSPAAEPPPAAVSSAKE